MNDQSEPRYWAFISYSHRNSEVATWLHRALERYAIPRPLHGLETRSGRIPKRIFPVFRDREEIPTSSDLGATIRDALQKSKYLIVICSPESVASKWVDEEIRSFKKIHGNGRVLGLVVAGEPNALDKPGMEAEECFPFGFNHDLNAEGKWERIEPIAADIRPGHDSRQVALLRLIAGILGVDFDSLWQRDRRRRKRQLLTTAIATTAVLAVVAALSLVAIHKNKLAAENAAVAGKAVKQAKESDRLKLVQEYVDDLQSLPALWQQDRVDLIRSRLNRCATNTLPEDIRGFEWFYWDRLAHSPLATLANEHRVTSMDWSHDGSVLWFTDLKGRLHSWNVLQAKHTELRPTNSHSYFVAASPTDDRIALLSGPSTNYVSKLEIIDANGTTQAKLERVQAPFSCVAFSPDGSRLATGDTIGQAEVWDAKSLNETMNLIRNNYSHRDQMNPRALLDQHPGLVSSVCFSPDGRTVASVDRHAGLGVWDTASGRNIKRVWGVGHQGAISSVAFSKDGNRIATRSLSYTFGPGDMSNGYRQIGVGQILIWNKDASGTPIGIEFPGEAATDIPPEFRDIPILGDVPAAFARNDMILVTGVGSVVHLEDSSGTGNPDLRHGHTSSITSLRVSPNGRILATADVSGDIAIWALDQSPCGNREKMLNAPALGMVCGKDSNRRAVLVNHVSHSSNGEESLSEGKQILLFNGDTEISVEDSQGMYLGLVSSPDGNHFASLSHEFLHDETRVRKSQDVVRVWNFQTGKCVRKIVISDSSTPRDEELGFSARLAAFRGNDEILVMGRQMVHAFHLSTGASNRLENVPLGPPPQIRYEDRQSSVYTAPETAMCLAFSPDGHLAALGRASGDILIVNAKDWSEVQRLRGHRRGPTALCFSKDSRRLFSCSGRYVIAEVSDPNQTPGEVKAWDLNTGRECLSLTIPGDHEFTGLALSDDERKLTAVANAVELRSKRLPPGEIFSWDTRSPELPKIWGAATASIGPSEGLAGKTLHYASHASSRFGAMGFTSIAIHPSGEYLVAVDVGGSVILWNCRSGELIRTTSLGRSDGWCLRFLGNGSTLFATQMPFGEEEAYLRFPELTPTQPPADQLPNPTQTNSPPQYPPGSTEERVAKYRAFMDQKEARAKFRWETHTNSADHAWSLETTNQDGILCIYARNTATGALSEKPCAYEIGSRNCAFFPDNEHFATTGYNNEVHLWSVKVPAEKMPTLPPAAQSRQAARLQLPSPDQPGLTNSVTTNTIVKPARTHATTRPPRRRLPRPSPASPATNN